MAGSAANQMEAGDRSDRIATLDIRRLVAQGLRAQLEPISFVTGDLRVGLSFRPDTGATLIAVDTGGLPQIPTVPSDLERLRATLSQVPVRDIMAAMQQTLAGIEKVTAKLDAAADPLLQGAQRDIDAGAHAADAAEQAVTALQRDTSKTLGEIGDLAGDAHRQIDDRGAEMSRLLTSAERVARQTEALVASLNGLIGSRTQFRGDLEAAARDLAASSSALRGFSQTIERDPSAVLRGR